MIHAESARIPGDLRASVGLLGVVVRISRVRPPGTRTRLPLILAYIDVGSRRSRSLGCGPRVLEPGSQTESPRGSAGQTIGSRRSRPLGCGPRDLEPGSLTESPHSGRVEMGVVDRTSRVRPPGPWPRLPVNLEAAVWESSFETPGCGPRDLGDGSQLFAPRVTRLVGRRVGARGRFRGARRTRRSACRSSPDCRPRRRAGP